MKLKKKESGSYELDVRGYVCPHPQLYTKKSMEKIKPGDQLEVVFDNPSSAETISALADKEGHKILERNTEGGTFRFKLQKA